VFVAAFMLIIFCRGIFRLIEIVFSLAGHGLVVRRHGESYSRAISMAIERTAHGPNRVAHKGIDGLFAGRVIIGTNSPGP
jgi:hypothetical protein